MILTLEEAKEIKTDVTVEDLNAFETAVRQLTNNKFQNIKVRYESLLFEDDNVVKIGTAPEGLRVGDTIEISETPFNNGLYVIKEILEDGFILEGNQLFKGVFYKAFLTKIEYPADIKAGIKKLLEYDVKTADKLGIKSETIARMSVTYYDMTNAESVDGYPASLMGFLSKYNKMRW